MTSVMTDLEFPAEENHRSLAGTKLYCLAYPKLLRDSEVELATSVREYDALTITLPRDT